MRSESASGSTSRSGFSRWSSCSTRCSSPPSSAAVAILGATVSPYLLNFYASGAVEDGWDEGCLRSNTVVAWLGTAFGAVVSLAILVVAALVLAPGGIRVEGYEQAALV